MTWWREAVVYQIYPRSFYDANGDGVGDIAGIIDKLDYLNDGTTRSLGVDALWLSPIYPSPMFDFGYDISDYAAIDPVFGTMDDFRRLLTEAHRRGIRIIMDLVLNHTSHLHPWFVESRASRESPKRDWYLWHDPVNGGPPNNWLGCFGGAGWTMDPGTGQYYYHSFLKEQPDLNWRNPSLRAAIFQMIRGWLEMGVDGFRLDVINLLIKDAQLRDNPVRTFKLGRPYDRQRHEFDRDRPELYEILDEFRALLEEFGDRTSVGEIMVEDYEKVPRVASYCGETNYLHMAFNFAFFFSDWNAVTFRRRIEEWTRALERGHQGWPTYTLSNHDFARHISRYKAGAATEARARLALLLLLSLRGTPFLYYGEEIGMREEPVSRRQMRDPLGLRYWPLHPGRDGCRRPMAWADVPGGGFTKGDPWLPVSPAISTINVAAQEREARSLLSFYRRAIWFRRGDEVLRKGTQTLPDNLPEGVLGIERTHAGKRRIAYLNFKDRPVVVRPGVACDLIFSTDFARDTGPAGGEIVLGGVEGIVLAV